MTIRAANRTALRALVSVVLALGVLGGVTEHDAHAQRGRPKTQKPKKDKKKGTPAPEAAAPPSTPAAAESAPAAEEPAPASDAAPSTQPAPVADVKAPAPESSTGSEQATTPEGALDTSVESRKAVYISGDLAITRSDLGAIVDNTGFDRTGANGLLYGLSAGVRLGDLRFGGRWRVYDTSEFALWTFAFSAGFGLPIRPISPVFSAHVGYAFDQSMEPALVRSSLPVGTVLPPDVDVKGIIAGVDVNASYWVTKFFRVGAFIGADLLFLNREKVAVPSSIYGPVLETPNNPLFTGAASSIGMNFNLGLRGAFDIGFK